jgi:hypothetical protein
MVADFEAAATRFFEKARERGFDDPARPRAHPSLGRYVYVSPDFGQARRVMLRVASGLRGRKPPPAGFVSPRFGQACPLVSDELLHFRPRP